LNKGQEATRQDHSNADAGIRNENREYEKRLPDREKRTRAEVKILDEEEHDRCKMAEIVHRMEEKKAAKELEGSRQKTKETKDAIAVVDVPREREKRDRTDTEKVGAKKMADSQRGKKKVVAARSTTTAAHATQREAARQWAAEETSDASTATQSTRNKGSMRLRAVK